MLQWTPCKTDIFGPALTVHLREVSILEGDDVIGHRPSGLNRLSIGHSALVFLPREENTDVSRESSSMYVRLLNIRLKNCSSFRKEVVFAIVRYSNIIIPVHWSGHYLSALGGILNLYSPEKCPLSILGRCPSHGEFGYSKIMCKRPGPNGMSVLRCPP